MILTGSEIAKEVKEGNIFIENFVREKVNPNSYNLTLNEKLLVYTLDEYLVTKSEFLYDPEQKARIKRHATAYLDSKKPNKTKELIIPEDGLVLEPGILYLAQTNEFTSTDKYVPMIDGRSSIARLGMKVHVTAGFGDLGFAGRWTLEIEVTHPLKVYPNMEICQISYRVPQGEISHLYNGKYQHSREVTASRMYKDFE